MHEKEQRVNAIRDNSSETIASIILADIERIEKQEQEIKKLNKQLELDMLIQIVIIIISVSMVIFIAINCMG